MTKVLVTGGLRGGTPGSPTSPLLGRSVAAVERLASRPAKPASGREAGGPDDRERRSPTSKTDEIRP